MTEYELGPFGLTIVAGTTKRLELLFRPENASDEASYNAVPGGESSLIPLGRFAVAKYGQDRLPIAAKTIFGDGATYYYVML
jgi:hypothetical protein